MNICILFILFNGMSYVTPACYTTGPMLEPHDVVYLQHLPYEYVDIVYESPRYYSNHYRRYRRYVSHWRGYFYSPLQHRRYTRHRRNYRSHRHHVYHWRNHNRNRIHRHHNHIRRRPPTRRTPRLKRRTVRRTYDSQGNLRRRVTTRRYRTR